MPGLEMRKKPAFSRLHIKLERRVARGSRASAWPVHSAILPSTNLIPDGRTGPGPYFCPNISVVNPIPSPLRVCPLQFCSVGRIGPSPPDLDLLQKITKRGRARWPLARGNCFILPSHALRARTVRIPCLSISAKIANLKCELLLRRSTAC